MSAASSQPDWRFGVYEVDQRSGELRRSGVLIRIQEQPLRVLTALLERAGDLVTREELRQALWSGDTFVDFEHSLNAAVNKLRETLGDSASHPRFVETVPRRGYRFIYPVARPSDPTPSQREVDPASAKQSESTPRTRWLVLATVSLAAVSLALVFFGQVSRPGGNDRNQQLAAVPLTSVPGLEMNPTFSPDGNQIAFSWDGPRQDNFNLYIKMVGGADAFHLTEDPAVEFSPAWSPDGRWIAFLRQIDYGKAAVRLVSPLGGNERNVGEIGAQYKPGNLIQGFYLSWTPDSEWLAVQDHPSPVDPGGIWLLSPASGERRRVTDPNPGTWGDFSPAFSSDGRSMAFVRIGPGFSLFLLDLNEDYTPRGEPRPLVSDRRQKYGPVFTADGKRLIYGSGEWSDPSLWEVAVSGHDPPRRLSFVGEGGEGPAISAAASRLAYTRFSREWNIWTIERTGPGQYEAPVRVVASTRFEKDPKLSADGSSITFASTRSGYLEIWVANADGSGLQQLTFFEGPGGGSPRWSPDGKYIAFDGMAAGNMDIYVIASSGPGGPRPITDDPASDHRPSWSQDGKWIYFASNRSGENQVYKVAVEGGEAKQLTHGGGWDPFESPDGAFVYYVRQDDTLWKIPAEGGEESLVCAACRADNGHSTLAVVEGGLYFFDPRPAADGRYAIRYLDLASGRLETVTSFERPSVHGLGASSDGRAIVYSKIEQEKADILLVENFR